MTLTVDINHATLDIMFEKIEPNCGLHERETLRAKKQQQVKA